MNIPEIPVFSFGFIQPFDRPQRRAAGSQAFSPVQTEKIHACCATCSGTKGSHGSGRNRSREFPAADCRARFAAWCAATWSARASRGRAALSRAVRSEERRVRKEGVSKDRSRGWPYHSRKKKRARNKT